MTDANGTRNNRPGDPNWSSAAQNKSPNNKSSSNKSSSNKSSSNKSSSTLGTGSQNSKSTSNSAGSSILGNSNTSGRFGGSASASRYRSKFISGSSPASATPKAGPKMGSDDGNSRQRSASEASSRRARRRAASNKPSAKPTGGTVAVERRRLFGSGPDRIKSKSSSRTRALKAKVARPSGQSSGRGPKKKGAIPFGKAAKATLAEKERPALPRSGSPGRVPPSRSLTRKKRRTIKTPKPVRIGIQLLIVGIGLAVIGATLFNPGNSVSETDPETTTTVTPQPTTKSFPVPLNQEIAGLKSELQELPNLYPDLTPKVFYVDVDNGQYANVDGGESTAAASTIKLPILLAFFEEVDAGRIDPMQTIAIQPSQIAEGSGDMQISPPGTQFTALEVATQMIINSDNTATNMMIDLLGGNEVLNSRFKLQGLEKTQLNNPLPDLEGTNTTSPRDLVHTILLISEGDELSMRSRDRILNILKRTYNKNLLAEGLEAQGALTYNKTGDIGSVLGDVSLVDLPNGKRYAIATLVERPDNDGRARELIRRISGRTYQEADQAIQPAVTPLGDPEANSPDAAGTAGEPGATTQPESALPEEEPYPSANPRQ